VKNLAPITEFTDATLERTARLTEMKGHAVDRTRLREREAAEAGYCRHGKYVGGMGIDWMCHYCEMGDTIEEEVDAQVYSIIRQVELVTELGEMVGKMDRAGLKSLPVLHCHLKMLEQVIDRPLAREVIDILHATKEQ
jgi:hypothetical protein